MSEHTTKIEPDAWAALLGLYLVPHDAPPYEGPARSVRVRLDVPDWRVGVAAECARYMLAAAPFAVDIATLAADVTGVSASDVSRWLAADAERAARVEPLRPESTADRLPVLPTTHTLQALLAR